MATAKKAATKTATGSTRGRPRIYASDAERQKAFRERHGMKKLSVDLPADIFDAVNEYMKFKGVTKTELFTKLIKSQLLRKR